MEERNDESAVERQAQQALKIGLDLCRKMQGPLEAAEDEIRKSGERNPANKHKVLFADLLRLAFSRYEALCLLFDHNFLDEAAIIARSVFEIALQAAFISISPEKRAAEFEEHGLARLHKYFKDMRPQWPEVARWFESTPWYSATKKAKWHGQFDNAFEMAKAIDEHVGRAAMKCYYRLFYPIESELAHASAAGMMRKSGFGGFDRLVNLIVGFGALMFVVVAENGDDVLGFALADEIRAANNALKQVLGD